LQQKDTTTAIPLLQKSLKYNDSKPALKNKTFLKLALIAYNQKNYTLASAYYDSLDLQDATLASQASALELRKTILDELVKNITIVTLQDSLQRIAKMPEKEMDSYLKGLVKKLRKQKGLKEEFVENPAVGNIPLKEDASLFSNSGKGNNWYFNNTSQKAKGYSEFISIWGKRPNIDNWRRQSAVDIAIVKPNLNPQVNGDAGITNPVAAGEIELTVDGLKKNLPLTEEQLKESNKSILSALITQGQIYKNQLEDYQQAALVFEEIWNRFKNFDQEEETLFELYYCNKKAGNTEKAAYFQSLLHQKFPEGNFETKLKTLKNPVPEIKDEKKLVYEKIYNLFIEGNFEQALKEKKIADSLYAKTYWTPQLLYIEALYHIKQKNDSTALLVLTDIETNFPGTPMAEKAVIIKDVVNRRAEIETYLTNTNIVRQTEDAIVIPFDEGPKVNKLNQEIPRDSTKITIQNKPAQNNNNLQKPKAPVEKVGIEKNNNPVAKIKLGNKPGTDSTRIKPLKDIKVEMAYLYNANEPYVVLMYFEKVDPIYISESKIAIQRYNNSNHTTETIQINIYEGTGDELSWLDLGPYSSVTPALGYFDELKANARQIVPWLPADKYNFIVISQSNLEIFKTRKNMSEYKLFIGQYIKDKF
jgi:outer membrane protein assembly factor BamD (BamD/ComL family)